MAKLSKILLGLFATGYSTANYETVSCNNDESVSFTWDKNYLRDLIIMRIIGFVAKNFDQQ